MTNEPFVPPSPASVRRAFAFPKDRRLRRRAEFRQVYDQGFRIPCACFVAFCWKSPLADGPKVGFTTPRALGKAVVRNRMRRRLREVVRVRLSQLAPEWRIVWNLRRAALTAPVEKLAGEVERVFERCKP